MAPIGLEPAISGQHPTLAYRSGVTVPHIMQEAISLLDFLHRPFGIWARLMAEATAKGRPRSALDMIIAAIGEAIECVVVTDNEKDFAELKNRQSIAGRL
jgi:predicted nucleic acid-binding protein